MPRFHSPLPLFSGLSPADGGFDLCRRRAAVLKRRPKSSSLPRKKCATDREWDDLVQDSQTGGPVNTAERTELPLAVSA